MTLILRWRFRTLLIWEVSRSTWKRCSGLRFSFEWIVEIGMEIQQEQNQIGFDHIISFYSSLMDWFKIVWFISSTCVDVKLLFSKKTCGAELISIGTDLTFSGLNCKENHLSSVQNPSLIPLKVEFIGILGSWILVIPNRLASRIPEQIPELVMKQQRQQCPFGKNRRVGDWYTIYHHLPVVKGVVSNPSINQPTNGNLGHLWTEALNTAHLGWEVPSSTSGRRGQDVPASSSVDDQNNIGITME